MAHWNRDGIVDYRFSLRGGAVLDDWKECQMSWDELKWMHLSRTWQLLRFHSVCISRLMAQWKGKKYNVIENGWICLNWFPFLTTENLQWPLLITCFVLFALVVHEFQDYRNRIQLSLGERHIYIIIICIFVYSEYLNDSKKKIALRTVCRTLTQKNVVFHILSLESANGKCIVEDFRLEEPAFFCSADGVFIRELHLSP